MSERRKIIFCIHWSQTIGVQIEHVSAFWRLPKSQFHVWEVIIADLWGSLALATPPTQPRTQASEHAIIVISCALATSLHKPPTKAQPCVPMISTMHGQPFLIPLIWNISLSDRWPTVPLIGPANRPWMALLGDCPLTHLPLDKIAALSQTMFPDAFPRIKSFVFWLKFHWSLFLRVQ